MNSLLWSSTSVRCAPWSAAVTHQDPAPTPPFLPQVSVGCLVLRALPTHRLPLPLPFTGVTKACAPQPISTSPGMPHQHGIHLSKPAYFSVEVGTIAVKMRGRGGEVEGETISSQDSIPR